MQDMSKAVVAEEFERKNHVVTKMIRWRDAHNRLREIEQQHDVAIEDIKNELVGDAEFISHAQRMFNKDKHLWKRAADVSEKLRGCNSDNMKEEVASVFCKVFKRLRSKTEEICLVVDRSSKITVGEQGFGIRYNMKSKPVDGFYDVEAVVRSKDAVIAGLKDLVWAKKLLQDFSDFCDIIGGLKEWSDGVITIKTDMFLLPWGNYDGVGTKYSDALVFGNKCGMISFLDGSGRIYEYHLEGGRSWGQREAIVYLQLRPNLEKYVEEFESRASPVVERSKTMIKKLQERFARRLLAVEL